MLIKLVSEIRDALRDELEMGQIGALTCKMQQIGDIFNFTKHKQKTVTASQNVTHCDNIYDTRDLTKLGL